MRTRRPPAAPAARSHASRGRAVPDVSNGVRHGLARVLSKAGVCSRSEAARWISDGRVRVSGTVSALTSGDQSLEDVFLAHTHGATR